MARPRVGLALSGGTAKSVAHVGVIKALAEAGIPVDAVAGTSGGSIVAAMFASGMPLATMESIATNMSWRKLVSVKLTRLGFISSERIETFVRDLIGDVRFGDLAVPCAVVATDLVSGRRRVFTDGPVARAVRASCSIPQIYLPVEIDGRYYVDGGLAEYLPVRAVTELGAEFTIASHLAPYDWEYRRPRHILHLVVQITGLMARQNFGASERAADHLVHPNLDAFSSFDFDHAGEMIELAYRAAASGMDDLRRRLDEASRPWNRLARRLRRGRR